MASTQGCGITHIKIREFSYKWIIKNFEHSCLYFVSDHNTYLNSPKFSIGDQSKFECDLTIRESTIDPNYYSIFLYAYDKTPVGFHVIISLINAYGKEAFVKRKLIDKPETNLQNIFDRFIEKDYLFDEKNKLLSNGTLTVICKMCFYEDTVKYLNSVEQNFEKIGPQNSSIEHIDNDLERLIENNPFSDFKIIANQKEFPVNKCILAARSRVFAAMLELHNKESRDGQVEINDIEPEVIQEMLRFIYSGKVNDIERMAPGLLVAAEKYELEGLKSTCQEILIKNMSLDNIVEVLVLVDKICVEKLKTATIEFIIENSIALNGSEIFKKASKSLSSSFLTDITQALMTKL